MQGTEPIQYLDGAATMYVQYVLCILTSLGTADTLLVVGIVAVADQAEPTVVDVHETVGAGLQKPLVP